MADLSVAVIPIVALDVPRVADALALVDQLGELCRFYKIGSELFTAEGPAVVREVQRRGGSVFLDLKLHDIPNTVRGAARSAARLGVQLLTVHGSGGRAMLEAAVAGVTEGGSDAARCRVLAVTVLTSMDRGDVSAVWGREIRGMEAEVLRLAGIAADSGVHGVVCSGREAGAVHAAHGNRLDILVPGVRLAGGAHQDQARVVTPREAAASGARYIVIGRAVTASKSPRDAMTEVLSDLP